MYIYCVCWILFWI